MQKAAQRFGRSGESKRSSALHVKVFDRYIIRKFLGTFMFSLVLLIAIVIMFDVIERLDAVINAPLRETIFKYYWNYYS